MLPFLYGTTVRSRSHLCMIARKELVASVLAVNRCLMRVSTR